MSMSDTTENDVLEMICKGTDPSWRAGATGYWALFTADPGETGSLAAECNYTGYARVSQTKATAWTDGGSTFSNAALVQWPQCTGGTNDAISTTRDGRLQAVLYLSLKRQTVPYVLDLFRTQTDSRLLANTGARRQNCLAMLTFLKFRIGITWPLSIAP